MIPDLSGFPQPAGLGVRPVPPVQFQVLGPGGRGRRARLDHRVPVVVVGRCSRRGSFARGPRGDGDVTAGDRGVSGGGEATAAAVNNIYATVMVDVGYDNGVSGTVGPVAVGPPEQPHHNIRRTRCRRVFRWRRRRENRKESAPGCEFSKICQSNDHDDPPQRDVEEWCSITGTRSRLARTRAFELRKLRKKLRNSVGYNYFKPFT